MTRRALGSSRQPFAAQLLAYAGMPGQTARALGEGVEFSDWLGGVVYVPGTLPDGDGPLCSLISTQVRASGGRMRVGTFEKRALRPDGGVDRQARFRVDVRWGPEAPVVAHVGAEGYASGRRLGRVMLVAALRACGFVDAEEEGDPAEPPSAA